MMRLTLFLTFFLILLLLPLQTLAGASIVGPLQGRTLSGMFEPGKVIAGQFSIGGAEQVEALLDGDLAQYATLDDPDPDGAPRTISFRLVLPEKLEPGTHILYIIAKEIPKNKGQVGGIAAAVKQLSIKVLWDTPLLKVNSFTVENVAVGDPSAAASIKVQSMTKQEMRVYADITVLAPGGLALFNVKTTAIDLQSAASGELTATIPTRDYDPGPYEVQATVHYVDNKTDTQTEFRVGTLELFLENYTRELSVDTINKFSFIVRSNWNRPLEGTHGTIGLGDLEEPTPDETIPPFGTAVFTGYLDTHGFTTGTQEGEITVVYEGGKQSFPIKIAIINETSKASQQAEVELQRGDSFAFSPTLLLYIALILLVVFNLILLLRRRKE